MSYLLCFIFVYSSTVLNKSGESGNSCLFPDRRGKVFKLSSISIMLATGLLYMAFIMLSYILSVPNLLRGFMMKKCCILSNAFYASIEMIIWFFIFHSINMMCHIYWFACWIILAPRDKSHLIVVYDTFNVFLNLVC